MIHFAVICLKSLSHVFSKTFLTTTTNTDVPTPLLTSGFDDAVDARLGGGGGGWLGGGTLGRLGGGGGRSVGGRVMERAILTPMYLPTVLGLGALGALLWWWWWLAGKVREGSRFSSPENLWFWKSEDLGSLMLLVRAADLLEERESPLG